MDLKSYQLHKEILCIDLKSFYASVECVLRNLDPFKTPLVVADQTRGKGGLCLAITPYLKSLGIPSRVRIFDIPKEISGNLIYAKPRMKTYMEYSLKVIQIYLKYVSYDDLYVYSIDEAFLDLTPYKNIYKTSAYHIGKRILDDIYEELGLYAACGVGPNMLMAKLALDIEAKHQKGFIAEWNYDDIPQKLWPISPLSEMWGIGHRMEQNLNQLGIFTIKDLAEFPVERLKKLLGVIGEELWYHAHGIDMSILQQKNRLRKLNKSLGQSQVLFQDYYPPDIYIIMQEMVDEVTRRLRIHKKEAKTIHLSIGYSKTTGGGFSRQVTLDYPTHSEYQIFKTCLEIFEQFYENEAIRTIGISLSGLVTTSFKQLSIFENEEMLVKEEKLMHTIDEIKNRFGKNSLNRGSSLEEKSTIRLRNTYVGGHHE